MRERGARFVPVNVVVRPVAGPWGSSYWPGVAAARDPGPRSTAWGVSCKADRVPGFTSENLTGSRFEDVYLTGAQFHDVDGEEWEYRLYAERDLDALQAAPADP